MSGDIIPSGSPVRASTLPVRAEVQAYLVPLDASFSELTRLASVLSDAVPGRYTVDLIHRTLSWPDGTTISGGVCVVVITGPAGNGIVITEQVDIYELRTP